MLVGGRPKQMHAEQMEPQKQAVFCVAIGSVFKHCDKDYILPVLDVETYRARYYTEEVEEINRGGPVSPGQWPLSRFGRTILHPM